MKYDYLIVGGGLSGCVLAERIATQLDKKCLIVEKRNHIGGNVYDYFDDNGVLVHKYGPHIFHTLMKKVWDYTSKFTEWRPYFHKVLAMIEGKLVPVPFNLNSIDALFPQNFANQLSNTLSEKFGYGMKIPILKLLETDNQDLKFLADYIYKNVFLGYNLKQWGLKPEELDSNVSGRLPVFVSRDNRYFQDTWQGIPKLGYTKMIENMINHKNIHLLLNVNYKDLENETNYDKMIFTGHIDHYFNYELGHLPYRTLNFKFENHQKDYYQELAQINYPNNFDYTRITEFKHLTGQNINSTTIAYEFSEEFVEGKNDPYYPIPKKENNSLFDQYKALANSLDGKVYFVGRLADYKYYNMDQTIGVALQLFEKKISAK